MKKKVARKALRLPMYLRAIEYIISGEIENRSK
jgi:hypothetical protein